MRIPIDFPAGLTGGDSSYASAGQLADCSNIRFWRGRAQVRGGWESLTQDLLSGVCRNVFPWTDTSANLNVAFGTHSHLQLWLGGALSNITPTLARPSFTLGANPLAVTTGSAVVTVSATAHGLTTGDSIAVNGAAALGGITPNGTFTVTVTGANAFTYTFSSNASSTVSGGGSAVVIAPQAAFASGNIDGTGGAGYGVGVYSVGNYSEPSTAEYFPRTWGLAAWGQRLLASPRGGAIYEWANNTAVRAAPLANSPRQVTHMIVASQDQVFALGCNEEVSGTFNPLCIRHSSIRKNTEWATGASTTAREYILPGGGRIVAGRALGPYLLVWTSQALFLGTYVGQLAQPWRFDRVGANCGLAGPNAVVVLGQSAFWVGTDLQFYRYGLGGAVEPIVSPIRDEFADNLSASQADKIVAASTSMFSEVLFYYPDARDGTENSRYLSVCTIDGAWSRGIMDRTAYVDAGPSPSPIGVTSGGAVYWHERGESADGGPIPWFLETADLVPEENYTALVRAIYPDISGQVGAITCTVTARFDPQGTPTTSPPLTLTAGAQKVDCLVTGRLFRLRFEGNSSPASARFGRMVFDIARAGKL